jgi:ribonucleoside-diphosphate reductase alpha chain
MKEEYRGILIDNSRDGLFNDMTTQLLNDYYMQEGESSVQHAFARASICFCGGDLALAQRLYDAASQRWFSYSSPILSNAPTGGWENGRFKADHTRAMPISCFLSYVDDSIKGQIEASSELAALSVSGGGVGQHFKMRGVTDKSPGAIPYLKTSDSNILYYKQGKTRKGSVAAYLDISHPDIIEFLNVRVPTGGDINRKCLNVHNAINITDEFMAAAVEGTSFNLRCPHTNDTTDVVDARELWQSILETRFRTGEPYINYIDEANRQLSGELKLQGFEIHGSNLCNEIHLPTDHNHTAVCCLSSVNLEHYDEWKDKGLVADLITMLDNVLDYFIEYAPMGLEKAVASARGFRDLGLGVMGAHSYFQKNSIPFDSVEAYTITNTQMRTIKEEADETTIRLAHKRGEPSYMLGTGRRNAHLLAVAPTANSSIIAGCSPSIEPWNANTYTHRTRLGSHIVKNKALDELLWDKAEQFAYAYEASVWVEKQWELIILDNGSVKSLEYLTEHEKAVFRTVWEEDQNALVKHARIRQQYIDQGQSVNLFFPRGVEKSYVNQVHLAAFALEGVGSPLKGLYYLNTDRGKGMEKLGKAVVRDALKDYQTQEVEECVACQV